MMPGLPQQSKCPTFSGLWLSDNDIWFVRMRKTSTSSKAWVAYKIAKVGKRLGTVHGATEKEALANAQKEFAKTKAEKKRVKVHPATKPLTQILTADLSPARAPSAAIRADRMTRHPLPSIRPKSS
jgi:hypothetical protein